MCSIPAVSLSNTCLSLCSDTTSSLNACRFFSPSLFSVTIQCGVKFSSPMIATHAHNPRCNGCHVTLMPPRWLPVFAATFFPCEPEYLMCRDVLEPPNVAPLPGSLARWPSRHADATSFLPSSTWGLFLSSRGRLREMFLL